MSKEKLVYIDYFRAIAIIFIVLGHSMLWGHANMRHFNVLFFSGWTFSFVFIAGFLFQYLAYKFNYPEYLKKKFKNVIMPYLVTLTPVALLLTFTLTNVKHAFYPYSKILRLIASYIGGYEISGPLWFVGMIFFIFLLAPVFLWLKKYKKIWYTLIILSFIYSAFLTSRPPTDVIANHGWLTLILSMIICYLKYVAYYLFAYILGMETCSIFETHYLAIKKHSSEFLFVTVPLWATVFAVTMAKYSAFGRYQTILKCIAAYIVLFLLVKFEENIKSYNFLDKSLKFIANYSFGIFFIHKYFINLIKKHSLYNQPVQSFVDLSPNTIHSFTLSVMIFIVSFFGSIIILYVIKKILNKCGIENTRKFIGV